MFRGSLVALITPMQNSGEIDYPRLHELIEWHLSNKTDGFVILGTTGESPTVISEERVKIIRQVVDQVRLQVPVIVGTGSNATNHAIALTEQAKGLGADAAMLVTPYYNRPMQEGLFQHYKAIAKAVPIPQILYNVPSRTGCDLLPSTIARLVKECPNIVGSKEAVGDSHRIQELMSLVGDDLDLFSGDDATTMEFILAGGKGAISVVANVKPKEFRALCHAALEGNREQAQIYQNKLKSLQHALFLESSPIPVKWALEQMEMIEGGIRLPLTPLNPKYHDDVRRAMQ